MKNNLKSRCALHLLALAMAFFFSANVQAQKTDSSKPTDAELRTGGKNSGRSNTSSCCAKLVAYTPPAGGQSANERSKFTLANKSGGTNPKLFGGNPPAAEVTVWVFDAKGNAQDPKKWSIKNVDDTMAIDLSALPKGRYRFKLESGGKSEVYETVSGSH